MNDDLISRQAAIDALGEEPDIALDTEEEWVERNAWATHVRAIKSLPSAEPVVKTATSTEDCISRQATIEAIEERFFAGTVADINPSWKLLHEIIESLPPVGSTPVEDAISREAAMDMVSKYYRSFTYESDADELIVELEMLPSSEPQRPKGEWINDTRYSGWTCTHCNYHDGNKTDKFCPNCRADMRGADDDRI